MGFDQAPLHKSLFRQRCSAPRTFGTRIPSYFLSSRSVASWEGWIGLPGFSFLLLCGLQLLWGSLLGLHVRGVAWEEGNVSWFSPFVSYSILILLRIIFIHLYLNEDTGRHLILVKQRLKGSQNRRHISTHAYVCAHSCIIDVLGILWKFPHI